MAVGVLPAGLILRNMSQCRFNHLQL